MTDWVRLWHDMPTDPKWRVVARKSGQPLSAVIAVFTLMMTNASGNGSERGALLNWDHEDAAAALDLDEAEVRAIYEAMQGKVLDGDRLAGWDKRQPKREDNSTGRVQEHRKRTAEQAKRDETQCNAPETETETETEGLSSDDDRPSADGPALKPEHVFQGYQKLAAELGLPVPRDFTPERRAMVRHRIAQHSLADFQEVFARCRGSPFLRGDKNDGRTPLSFDWLMQKKNFQKVLEGNFDD